MTDRAPICFGEADGSVFRIRSSARYGCGIPERTTENGITANLDAQNLLAQP